MFYRNVIDKYTGDKKFNSFFESVISDADEALNTAEVSFDEASGGKGQHGDYVKASVPFEKNIPILGFAYLYTKNEKYAEKAKKLMLLYAGYERWNGDWVGRSELNNARFCSGMAFGYIMLKDYLTADEKKTIAEGTLKNGISPIAEDWVMPNTRIHALDTMGHNWWIVCIADALMAAVCMQNELGLKEDYIEQLRNSVEAWFKYEGNPINVKPKNYCNGGFYEGINYANYAVKEYGMCKYIYKHIKNKEIFEDTEYMINYMMFFVNTVVPSTKKTFVTSFGDGGDFASAVSWLLGCGVQCPEAVWYIHQWKERKPSWQDVVFYEELHDAFESVPQNTHICYNDIGWAIMRKSFESDTPVLAVKCGDSWNHAHLDAGHFNFSNYGEDIIYDSGCCKYGRKEYVDYYCSSYAHNVLLFNGAGQDDRDRLSHARMTGKLYNPTQTENVQYIAADATGPMGRYFRRHIRHFLWLEDFILIYDDVEAHEKGEVSFLIHIDNKYSDKFVMLTETEKSNREGNKKGNADEKVLYDCYSAETDDNGRIKFVSIIKLKDDVKIEFEQNEEFFTVVCGNAKVYINILSDGRIMHKNCICKINDFVTDSVMFADFSKGYFIVNGSLLRKGGRSLYDNLCRRNIEIKK